MTSPNPNWPANYTFVDFTTDPFDQGATESWIDISSRVQSLDSSVGRQYELDQNQAGEATYTLFDSDEALNPSNTGSPYYPNIKIYRQIIDMAMWPNQTTGNLLNTNYGSDSRLGTTAGYDPSFESYAVGASVPWITANGGISPVVSNASAFQGTQSLNYSTNATTARQGITVVVPCIPNQQYTDSLYVNQASAFTEQIAVGGLLGSSDQFGRTVSNGWGSDDLGNAWTVVGTASDYSVSGGFGLQNNTAVSTAHLSVVGSVNIIDCDVYATVTNPAFATGSYIAASIISRYTSSSNYYHAGIRFNTDGTISYAFAKVVGGTGSTISSGSITSVQYTAGASYQIRAQTIGTTLNVKLWIAGTPEPSTWTATTTDTSLTGPGQIGLRSILNAGNTNAPLTISWDAFRAGVTLVGTSTTTTGSWVRLTVTYTATTSLHSINLFSFNSSVVGSVSIDAIQHEQGATANTFTTSGPTIYGVWSGYVERWPSSWNYQGTYGMAQITCVDAFAPMAGQDLWTEYKNAVLSLSPAYFWPLSESVSEKSLFADISGNNGQPFKVLDSVFGAGPLTSQAMNIPGDPSGNGVKFSQDTTAGPNYISQKVSFLDLFRNVGGSFSVNSTYPALSWGQFTIQPYSYSASWWDQSTGNTSTLNLGQANHFMSIPIWYLSDSSGAVGGSNDTHVLSFNATILYGVDYADGKLHHIVVTVSGVSGTESLALWIDGVNVANATAAISGTFTGPWGNDITLGAYPTAGVANPLTLNGAISNVAVWNRQLSSSEVATLYSAGANGYSGESSGARVSRYLGYQFVASSNAETGSSTMGISTLANNTSLLDACQNVATTENGNIFCDPNGIIQFQSRAHRYIETSATWIFGENQAGGEIPYLGDLVFDYDPTQVYNDVQVTNSGGIVSIGGDISTITASRKRYGKRSYQRTVNVLSNNEAIDASDWIFYSHTDPVQRIEQVTVDIAANPSLFATVFRIRIGDRATLKRRTTAFTMSSDYFIERIEHSRGPGKWQMIFQMSPVLGKQPWILGDATYGVLGTTTILGY